MTLQTRLNDGLRGRYVVERELGRGGMATVFLARDLKHERSVAIKVLHPELGSAIGTERFLREIRTAAQLVHPHILALHDSGSTDGLLFYTMPHIQGESLAERLRREGPLPVDEAVRIARDVADALAYAHDHGVVHRDIKPENILLARGRDVAVADFGLASAVSADPGQRLTATGIVIGSPLYMAPEQIAGKEPGFGADVYGLGCVIFEMLSGRAPFEGVTIESVLMQHLSREPPSLRTIRPDAPRFLEEVVSRSLAKRPEDRVPSARSLHDLLSQSATGGKSRFVRWPRPVGNGAIRGRHLLAAALALIIVTTAGLALTSEGRWFLDRDQGAGYDPGAIAVLYFDDRSAGGELEYLANGLTERLIHELSQVSALKVVSRNGVRPFRDASASIDSIARALKVGTVVAGSLQRSGGKVRLLVDLIDASTGAHLQSRVLESEVADVLALEDELAVEVSEILRRRLGTEIRLRRQNAGTTSAAARTALMQAEKLREEATILSTEPDPLDAAAPLRLLAESDRLASRAGELDPRWLDVVVFRGWLAVDRARHSPGLARTRFYETALTHANRALQMREGHPPALELRGTATWGMVIERPDTSEATRMLREAEADLRRAISADPSLAGAWSSLSDLLRYRGDYAEAYHAAERALSEDAFLTNAAGVMDGLFRNALALGRYADANQWCDRGREDFPRDWRFVECQLSILSQDTSGRADPDRAWALVSQLDGMDPPEKARLAGRPYTPLYRRMLAATVLARAGRADSALAVVRQVHRAAGGDSGTRQILKYDEAYVRLLIGQPAEAIRLLRDYLAEVPYLASYVARDPLFRSLRGDSAFVQMIRSSNASRQP